MPQKKYDREFKLEAIRLASEVGHTAQEVERRLGIGEGMISRWKRQLRQQGEEAFPGTGHLTAREAQVRDLQRENERLRRERDILKNMVGAFDATCGGRNSVPWLLFPLDPGRSDRMLTGGLYPVKKRGPGIHADWRLVTPLGDPV